MKRNIDNYKENQRYTITLLMTGEGAMDFANRMEFEEICEKNNIEIERKTRIGISYMYRVLITDKKQYDVLNGTKTICTMHYSQPAVLDEITC